MITNHKKEMINRGVFTCLVIIFMAISTSTLAENKTDDLSDLNLDQLMNIEITSVSKKSEKLSQAAAAIYVVTADEIRRSGATNIPQALRLVPGVDVAQIDPNKWAVSIRGFNGRFANKLLVLIDGRSVYTSTYSGVYWEYLDYLMDNIKRIEVIRGPGATLWGTNAVNGVINIITRGAGENSGGALSVAAGNEYQGMSLRQAGELSDKAQVNAYVKAKHLDQSKNIEGQEQDNSGGYLQTGARVDIQPNEVQSLMLQGNLYRDQLNEQHRVSFFNPSVVNDDVDAQGGDLSFRWGLVTGFDSDISARLSYDFYDHDDFKYSEDRQTVNAELQHHFSPMLNHDIVWGAGYRWSENKMDYSQLVLGTKTVEYSDTWNLFMQDTLRFPESNISLIFGAKVEGSSYTGVEVQPNVRVSWAPDEQLTLWASISRANRTPSQFERELTLNYVSKPSDYGPVLFQVVGNDNFKSEQLDAYEFGVRWHLYPEISLDLATFYNDYENMRSDNVGDYSSTTIDDVRYTVIPLVLTNNIEGQSTGGELLLTWEASAANRFRFVYSFINVNIRDTQENQYSGTMLSLMENVTPEHQVSLWGSFDLSPSVEFDARLYYTSSRKWEHDLISDMVDADLRFAWQATRSLSLSIVGQNLLHSSRQQFLADAWPASSFIERSIFVKGTLTW